MGTEAKGTESRRQTRKQARSKARRLTQRGAGQARGKGSVLAWLEELFLKGPRRLLSDEAFPLMICKRPGRICTRCLSYNCRVAQPLTLSGSAALSWNLSCFQTIMTVLPIWRNSPLCRLNKAFYIRHCKANRSHSTESYGRLCALSLFLPCLLANNKNLSEQMEVNFGTNKTFRAPCHKDILQTTVGHLLSCIALYFLPYSGSVVQRAWHRITALMLWCEKSLTDLDWDVKTNIHFQHDGTHGMSFKLISSCILFPALTWKSPLTKTAIILSAICHVLCKGFYMHTSFKAYNSPIISILQARKLRLRL